MKFKQLSEWIPGLKGPLIIAGPCSAESEEQVLTIAEGLAKINGIQVYRAGIWKPRTRPNNFEGVGESGLPWLEKVKKMSELLTCIEVANARHVDLALKHNIDILWIGARTTVNPFSVQEIANRLKGVDIPVMVKNPINIDLALWVGAIERLQNSGITKLAAIHRGFATGEVTKYRNLPRWKIPLELKQRFPDLPLICDPSHIAGRRDLIGKVCQKAMDVDMDGLMVETHHDPDRALSDSAQQVTPETLSKIVSRLCLRTEYSKDQGFEESLEKLRRKIDRVDQELMEVLQARMKIVNDIGNLKRDNNITAFQVHRMDKMMNHRMKLAESMGLSAEYVKEIYNTIHEESVKVQTDIMDESDDGE